MPVSTLDTVTGLMWLLHHGRESVGGTRLSQLYTIEEAGTGKANQPPCSLTIELQTIIDV